MYPIRTKISMKKSDIELIKKAQSNCLERRSRSVPIYCPFWSLVNIFIEEEKDMCKLCHSWMGTNILGCHPCNQLPILEVRSRFYRNVGSNITPID